MQPLPCLPQLSQGRPWGGLLLTRKDEACGETPSLSVILSNMKSPQGLGEHLVKCPPSQTRERAQTTHDLLTGRGQALRLLAWTSSHLSLWPLQLDAHCQNVFSFSRITMGISTLLRRRVWGKNRNLLQGL